MCEAHLNFRYSNKLHADEIKHRTCTILDKHNLDYAIDWRLSGEPFLTVAKTLVSNLKAAIFGLTRDSGKGDISLAFHEAIAFQTKEIILSLEKPNANKIEVIGNFFFLSILKYKISLGSNSKSSHEPR